MMRNDDKNIVDSYDKTLLKRCAKEGGHESFIHREGLISKFNKPSNVFFNGRGKLDCPYEEVSRALLSTSDKVTGLIAPKCFFVACYLKKESRRDWEQD